MFSFGLVKVLYSTLLGQKSLDDDDALMMMMV
jgi:hypothetical protein